MKQEGYGESARERLGKGRGLCLVREEGDGGDDGDDTVSARVGPVGGLLWIIGAIPVDEKGVLWSFFVPCNGGCKGSSAVVFPPFLGVCTGARVKCGRVERGLGMVGMA